MKKTILYNGKKNRVSKALALLMAVLLMLSVMPFAASAAATDPTITVTGVQTDDVLDAHNGAPKWTITIDPKGNKLASGAVIASIPSITAEATQSVYSDSIAIYTGTVDPANKLIFGTDYTYTYDVQKTVTATEEMTATITMKKTIETILIIEYSAKLYTKANPITASLTNQAKLTAKIGSGSAKSFTSGVAEIVAGAFNTQAGVTAGAVVYDNAPISFSAKLVKTGTTDPLAGAKFQLYTLGLTGPGDPVGKPVATDALGVAAFTDIIPDTYYIVETTVPDGYTRAGDIVGGHQITPAAAAILPYTNTQTQVSLVSNRSIPGATLTDTILPGTTFRLEQKINNTWTRIKADENIKADDAGGYALRGLAAGEYRLTEITVPAGYIRNTAPLNFTVKADSTGVIQNDTVTFNTYKGGFQLTKANTNGGGQDGVVYKLTELGSTPTVIENDLMTASGGILTNEGAGLAPGKYSLEEITAASGQALDKTPIYFIVPESYAGEFDVNLGQMSSADDQKRVSLLVKKLNEKGEPLENAVFKLMDDNNNVIFDKLTTSLTGKFVVSGLDLAYYKIAETNAPEGYKHDTTSRRFEVKKDSNGAYQTTTIEAVNTSTSPSPSPSKSPSPSPTRSPSPTNTPKGSSGNSASSSPKSSGSATGDDSGVTAAIVLLLISFAAFVVLMAVRYIGKKKNGEGNQR